MKRDLPDRIHLIPNGAFDREDYGSTYLIEADELVLVDPGPSSSFPRLSKWFERSNLSLSRLKHVLLTHIHLDHAGAAGQLADEISGIRVYVHESGKPHLVDPTDLLASVREATGYRFRKYGTLKPVQVEKIVTFGSRSDFSAGSRDFVVEPTPGHAPHHVVYQDRDTGAVFVGDGAGNLFDGNLIPATPPPSFDLEKSLASLARIAELSPSVLLYSHFGPGYNPDKILEEYGKILRDWVDLVERLESKYGEGERLHREVIRRKSAWLDNGLAEEELIMNVRGVLRYLSRIKD